VYDEREAVSQVHREHRGAIEALAPGLRGKEAGALDALALLARRVHARFREVLRERSGGSPLRRARLLIDDLVRTEEPEELDRDDVGPERKRLLIEDLSALNKRIRAYETFTRLLAPEIERAAARRRGAPVRILEIGSGHGDLAFHLERWARAQGIAVDIAASDVQPVYVDLGNEKARARGSAVRFEVVDALDMGLATGSRDIVLLTQTVHHFTVGQVARLLSEATRVGAGALLVDGYRHPVIMGGAAAMLGLLWPRTIFHDGWISVRKVYAQDELALLAGLVPEGARARLEFAPPAYAVLRFPIATGSKRDTERV